MRHALLINNNMPDPNPTKRRWHLTLHPSAQLSVRGYIRSGARAIPAIAAILTREPRATIPKPHLRRRRRLLLTRLAAVPSAVDCSPPPRLAAMATTARSLHLPTPPKPSNPSHHRIPVPFHIRPRPQRLGRRLAASSSDLTSFPDPAPTPNGVYVPWAAAHPAAAAAIDVDAATEAELRENGFRSTRRTKLVCTIGPATCGAAELEALAVGGMNVARVNMCHGDREWHRGVIRAVRRLNDEKGFAVAVMMDTEGSEIHMGDLGGAPSAKAEVSTGPCLSAFIGLFRA